MTGARGKRTAKYDLAAVLRLLPDARIARGKATLEVKSTLVAVRQRRLSDAEADAYIHKLVRSLTPEAFVRRETLIWHDDAEADLYGAQNGDGDWYIKLYIDNGTLLVIVSCHEPKGALTRADGKRIGKPRK